MNRDKRNIVIGIFISILICALAVLSVYVPNAYSLTTTRYRWTSYQVAKSSDDCYVKVGAYISLTSWEVYIKARNHDMMTGIIFENVSKLVNSTVDRAYLSLYTENQTITDDPSFFTIYGINGNPSTFSTYSDFIVNKTETPALVNVNAYDDLQPDGYHNISVKNIVQYLTTSGSWSNYSTMGFKTLAEDGDEYIKFLSYDWNSSLAPRLYIRERYSVTTYPTPPILNQTYPTTDDYNFTYVETYRGFDIWRIEQTGIIDVWFQNATTFDYKYANFTVTGSAQNDRLIIDSGAGLETWLGHMDSIIRYDDWIICLIQHSGARLFYSNDNGVTWNNTQLNAQFTNTSGLGSQSGSLDVDSNGVIHVTWNTYTVRYPANRNIVYANFTIDNSGTLTFGSSDVVIISSGGGEQSEPDIFIDRQDRPHIAWEGETGLFAHSQIWYSLRFLNGTWKSRERVSTADDTYRRVSVVAEWVNNPRVYFFYYRGNATDDVEGRRRLFNGTYDLTETIDSVGCLYPSATINRRRGEIHMTYTKNSQIAYRGKNINYAGSSGQIVSGAGNQHYESDISVDEIMNRTYVIWYSPWVGHLMYARTSSQGVWLPRAVFNRDLDRTPNIVTHADYSVFYVIHDARTTSNTYCQLITNGGECEAVECARQRIDNYLLTRDDRKPNFGGEILMWMGMIGLIMIPLGFVLFVYNIQQGDFNNAFYLMMSLVFVGIGLVIVWLWG